MNLKNELKQLRIRSFIMLIIAGIINAFGVTVFLYPVKLYDSGISGTSMLLAQITPEYFTLSLFLLMLNIPLFLYGLKKQGAAFTIYAIFTVAVYSISAYLITDVLPLYSIVTYAAALKTIDYIVEGLDREKCAMIVTVKPNEVAKALSDAFEMGSTTVDAKGGYSKSPKTIVYFVVNRFQVTKMKSIVHETDPTAYITISEVADVFKANQ